ncbi:MAG: hypothetical protein ABL958_17940 [Bdellovibrionia bacterium]
MRARNPVAILILAGMIFPSNARALSTLDFWIPQGRTLVPGELKFDIEQRMTVDKSGGAYHRGLWGFGYGLFQWGRFTTEIGLDWREPTFTTGAAALAAHARLVFNNVVEDGWAIGVGIDQLGFHPGQNDYNVNHLVFHNLIGEEWEMAFGGFSGNSTFLAGDDKGMFVGLWTLIQSGHGRAGVEWMSGNSEFGYFVPGLKVEIREGVMGYLAYGFANRKNFVKDWLLLRVSILF